tara:strand:+ start:760 stop:978 length:219 start_codon:yes stop_codon:yes gene_type:complete
MPALTHGRVKNGFNGGRRLKNAKSSNCRVPCGNENRNNDVVVGNVGSSNIFVRRAWLRRLKSKQTKGCECSN